MAWSGRRVEIVHPCAGTDHGARATEPMPATGIAAILLIVTVLLAGLSLAFRSRKLAIVAAVAFGLLAVYVGLLILVIGGM